MQVLEDLRNILKLSGNERIEAVGKLLMRGINNSDVSVALGYLIAQDRFASNPFLLIAKARLDTENVIWKSGPGYDTLIQPLLSLAVKLANEKFNAPNGKNAFPAINRADAAYINREAAWMFAQIGKDKDFQQRDWISRFYGMPVEERAGLNEGDVISIELPVPDPQNTPRPRTEAEKNLIKVEDKRDVRLSVQSDMDKGRGIAETNDPRSSDRTEVHTETIETIETKGLSSPNQENKKDAYPKVQKQAKPSPGKIERGYATQVNQGSIAGTGVWSGALELLLRALNAKVFQVRMEAITQYIAEKHRLEMIIAGEKRRVVPMKPRTLEKLIIDFREYGRKTANPFEKKRILEVIIKLESMREESYAMWK